MRYSLRTLLIFLILMPPLGAAVWRESVKWRARWQEDQWIDVGGPGSISGFETNIGCVFDSIPENMAEENGEPASLEIVVTIEKP